MFSLKFDTSDFRAYNVFLDRMLNRATIMRITYKRKYLQNTHVFVHVSGLGSIFHTC